MLRANVLKSNNLYYYFFPDNNLQEIINYFWISDQRREDDDWSNHESHDTRYTVYYDAIFPFPLYMGSTIAGLLLSQTS